MLPLMTVQNLHAPLIGIDFIKRIDWLVRF